MCEPLPYAVGTIETQLGASESTYIITLETPTLSLAATSIGAAEPLNHGPIPGSWIETVGAVVSALGISFLITKLPAIAPLANVPFVRLSHLSYEVLKSILQDIRSPALIPAICDVRTLLVIVITLPLSIIRRLPACPSL